MRKSKILIYILPSLFIFSLLFLYIKTELPYFNKKINLLISQNKDIEISVDYENFKFNQFKVSFQELIPFTSVKKYKEIQYIKEIYKKCIKGKTTVDKNILKAQVISYSLNHPKSIYNEGYFISKLGLISVFILLYVILFFIKKIRNEKIKIILKFYILLLFSINLFFYVINKNSIEKLNNNITKKCFPLKATLEKEISKFKNKNKNEWKKIHIKNTGTIYIPPTLEIQEGKYKIWIDSFKQKHGYEVSDLIAQNKGVNNNTKSRTEKYARVMLNTEIKSIGSYAKLDFNIKNISDEEIENLNEKYKKMILNRIKKIKKLQPAKLIKWNKLKLEKINNMSCVHLQYERQIASNPIVLVNTYIFYNNDRTHILTMSYRKNEAKYWKNDFDNILHTLNIKKQ